MSSHTLIYPFTVALASRSRAGAVGDDPLLLLLVFIAQVPLVDMQGLVRTDDLSDLDPALGDSEP